MPYLKTNYYHEPEKPRLKLLHGLSFAIFLALAVGGYTFYHSRQADEVQARRDERGGGGEVAVFPGTESVASTSVEHAIATAIANIQRRLPLPIDETPLFGVLRDAKAVQAQQPFFENAQNGDMLLVYFNHKQAVLYRPSTDAIVNAGMVAIGSSTTFSSAIEPSVQPQKPPRLFKVEVRNGSRTTGAAARWVKNTPLDSSLYAVHAITKAARTNYNGVSIIPLSDMARQYSSYIKSLHDEPFTTIDLPRNERTSTADVLVIIGN